MTAKPRLAVRGIILVENRLLMVNAWPSGSNLICAPGGGVKVGQSLPDNLKREVHEETGLSVEVGDVVLVNEFHDLERAFHQVDVYYRCQLTGGDMHGAWVDPEGVVSQRFWLTRDELMRHHFKPDSLPQVVWDAEGYAAYDPLEPLIK